jgi:hypothetical protein
MSYAKPRGSVTGVPGLPWRVRKIGRLILTTCTQAGRAPFVDDGWTKDQEGNTYASKVILLAPWRRNRHGERPPMRALVVGWRQ